MSTKMSSGLRTILETIIVLNHAQVLGSFADLIVT